MWDVYEQLKALVVPEPTAAPATLAALLLNSCLKPKQRVDPTIGAVQLVDVAETSDFAEYVRDRARRSDANMVVSRVCQVLLGGKAESSFCDMFIRANDSRKKNSLMRPDNFTDDASVAGLTKLTTSFEGTSLGLNPSANIVMAWHGTGARYVESVCRDGMRSFRLTDGGFFGTGSYVALEQDYAVRYSKFSPPNDKDEYGVILFAVFMECAYVITPVRDYLPDNGPQADPKRGFSTFYSSDGQHAQVNMYSRL
jgi:Poly(ADP-ribose) polymerase catalytic domain